MPRERRKLRHWPSAHDVAVRGLDLVQLRALEPHQLEPDRHEVLGDDVQRRCRQEVVDVGDPAGDRVLHRDHGEFGIADGGRLRTRPRRSRTASARARDRSRGRRCGSWRPSSPWKAILLIAPLCPARRWKLRDSNIQAAYSPEPSGRCVVSPVCPRLPRHGLKCQKAPRVRARIGHSAPSATGLEQGPDHE